MYPSRVTGYQDPLSTFILNLVEKVNIFITLGDLQAPHICVITRDDFKEPYLFKIV